MRLISEVWRYIIYLHIFIRFYHCQRGWLFPINIAYRQFAIEYKRITMNGIIYFHQLVKTLVQINTNIYLTKLHSMYFMVFDFDRFTQEACTKKYVLQQLISRKQPEVLKLYGTWVRSWKISCLQCFVCCLSIDDPQWCSGGFWWYRCSSTLDYDIHTHIVICKLQWNLRYFSFKIPRSRYTFQQIRRSSRSVSSTKRASQ